MPNAFLVYFDKSPFITLLLPAGCLLTSEEIIDKYAKAVDLDRSRLAGQFIKCVDMTVCNQGRYYLPNALFDESRWGN